MSKKEFHLSKLKKEYGIYLDKIFLEKENSSEYYLKEEPTFYSKTYLTPYANVPTDLKIQVPLSLLTSNYKKRICFSYNLREVDHKKKELYFTLEKLFLQTYLGQSSTFEFNRDLNLNLGQNEIKVKSKILLSKNPPRKCSKKVQKQLISDLTQILRQKNYTFEEFILSILNRSFQKAVQEELKRNNEYLKTIVILSANR